MTVRRCTLCGETLHARSILIQEDPDLRAQQGDSEEGGWDWLPMGQNGMHYMLLHASCWEDVLTQLELGSKNAGFMFYLGNTSDLEEVALCLN